MSRPFLMLASRTEEVVADDEFRNLPRLAGMAPGEAVRVRLDREPFPEIDLDDWSGIILCGSPFDVSAPEGLKSAVQRDVEAHLGDLYDRMLQADAAFLGICYGMGTLTLHLGGAVDGSHAEEISAPRLTLTPEGRDDPLLEGMPERFRAYVGHHEAASGLAPGATLLVGGTVAPVQMIRAGESVYATQFHPELDLAGIGVRIEEYAGRGYYPPEERSRVEAEVAAADVRPVHLILRNFVRRFRR
ncbi:MAG: glutamine amidotransferase [Actinomyces sp.]|jgi:GMP synthase (glutamine-hydrolysing)|nr:glutamine amidotransferase [Actinomyces sp.]MCI1640920.1 glutamine amidotransferase [Actinomyces sp.]MCI1661288.1 glutamine amidotransferase [Actinomyces sp.]MCI1690296.1 glutamine amidotransferase [Actinomyces sp.]MCI1786937.1 glutamine amidotransferase [Actinomyces sp.]MCI1829497.1 glutamine amidotransferase [Actinomyces sp.]